MSAPPSKIIAIAPMPERYAFWDGPPGELRRVAACVSEVADPGENPLTWTWCDGVTVWFTESTPGELEAFFVQWPAHREDYDRKLREAGGR